MEDGLNEGFKVVEQYVNTHFQNIKSKIKNRPPSYTLMELPFDELEIIEAMKSLLSTNLTMGSKVKQFEQMWSDYLGLKETVMVNSGSSANLVALQTLRDRSLENRIPNDAEIITPALTWSTSVFPILDIRAKPVLIDVTAENFLIDIEAVKEAITPKTAAIMPVHLLGNPVDMPAIMDLAQDHNLWVIEDACEAHGASLANKKIGSFGHLSTFSFFFSHHITTIEGGSISTKDPKLANIARSTRAHGWIRERTDKSKFINSNPNIDESFLFVTHGYNLRPTELQASFGIHQIPKLDGFIDIRRKNHEFLISHLSQYEDHFSFLHKRDGADPSYFGFPIILKPNEKNITIHDLSKYLQENNVQTRPIMGGNFARQPVMENQDIIVRSSLEQANYIMDNGLFVGNHQDLREIDLKLLVDTLGKFVADQLA